MKGEQVICEKAYLYSLFQDGFRVYEGKVIYIEIFIDGKALFVGKKKSFSCSLYQGKILDSKIWFSERNDQEVVDILIKCHEERISELKKKIENHLSKINLIKGGVQNE